MSAALRDLTLPLRTLPLPLRLRERVGRSPG